MSVQHDSDDRRYVQAEVEVPGTPEEVWEAIATGRGISSWFVPTEVDEREGGEVKASFGPGMDSVSKVLSWDAPNSMTCESHDLGPDAPAIATEWIVEARDGGTCIVRVVHSLFTTSEDWDSSLEAWEAGWPDFFRILRLYLENYRGQFGELIQLSAMTSAAPDEAWAKLNASMQIGELATGDKCVVRIADKVDVPVHVEHAAQSEQPHAHEILGQTSDPVPGLMHCFTLQMGEQTCVSLRFYVFGDEARQTAKSAEVDWNKWLNELV